MPRPIKIVLLGAGSFFTSSLMRDVLSIPRSQGGRIELVDTDKKRLAVSLKFVKRLIEWTNARGWSVGATTSRRKVMKGCDYLINCIEVNGTRCVGFENDIPAKYGVTQYVGDTIGPGGLFKGLRTIPVFLQVLRDAEELCPDAWVLNYTNPMSMMCLAAGRTSPMKVVGLCHSVQGTSDLLAKRAGIPYNEMDWDCAGINHFAWFTTLKHQGKDLYPRLMAQAKDKRDNTDLVRKDMMLHFGAFITESSGHLSEYLPWYRLRKDSYQRYCLSANEGKSRDYATHWPLNRRKVDKARLDMLSGKQPFEIERSWEYASWIIEAREKDRPYRIYGNVMNTKDGAGPLISNLPGDGCVELACNVDRRGITPMRFGALPRQMAGLCDTNMRMFDLGAEAAMHKSKDLAYYALALDPLTSARCTPAETKKMCGELFKAEAEYLTGFH